MEAGGGGFGLTASIRMFCSGVSSGKINRRHNQALMDKCHRLWEYSELSAEVEENIRKGMVTHMLLTEYDEKKHLKNTFREGREEGLEAGEKIGREKGRQEKLEEMVSGLAAGHHTCHCNL